jgi:alkylhydroperoxidase/carboxymuconolactone decarboxylase family protein YurZ
VTQDWQDLIGRVELTPRQEEIRDAFIRRRGYWADDWQLILEMDPEFLAAYTEVSAYAGERGILDRRTRELIYVACGSAVSHQHPLGILTHGRNALDAGATPQELLAVMELVSTIGIGTVHLAVRELDARPDAGSAGDGTDGREAARLAAMRSRFEDVFHAWSPEVGESMRAVPDFYGHVVEMAAIPRLSGVLTDREIALISFAVDALVTNMDERALRRDIEAAVRAGVSRDELLDVALQIEGVGIHAVTVGVPILAQLLIERRESHVETVRPAGG